MSRNTFFPVLSVNFFIQSFIAVFFLFPAALQDQGLPLSQIGWLMSSFNMVSTVVRLVGGTVSEKVGVRNTLLFSSFFLILSSLPLVWTGTFLWILLMRVLMGIFFSIAMVSVSSYQAMIIPVEKRGSTYAWIGAAYALPQLTVFPVGDLFLSGGGYVPYVLLAPLMAFFCLVCSFKLPSMREQKSSSPVNGRGVSSWGKWGELLVVRGFWVLQLSVFLFAFVNSAALQFMPAYLNNSGLVASSFFIANAGMAMILRIVASRIMDHVERKSLMGLATSWIGLVMIFLIRASTNTMVFLEGAIYGVGMGFGFPVMLALMPDIFPDDLKPKGISSSFFTMDLGFIIS
ncbi:MAG TPA: MFS transporter, partial [Synergistales bacterium]|nr:MFS transporter [Synergistales bacterium]